VPDRGGAPATRRRLRRVSHGPLARGRRSRRAAVADRPGPSDRRSRRGDRLGCVRLERGGPAGVTWLAGACGRCRHYLHGRENLCALATFTGCDRDGGVAELATVRSDVAVQLPDEMGDLEAAPLLCGGVIGIPLPAGLRHRGGRARLRPSASVPRRAVRSASPSTGDVASTCGRAPSRSGSARSSSARPGPEDTTKRRPSRPHGRGERNPSRSRGAVPVRPPVVGALRAPGGERHPPGCS
jgi:hypothetical protein